MVNKFDVAALKKKNVSLLEKSCEGSRWGHVTRKTVRHLKCKLERLCLREI